jgi:hypothetical protein
MLVHGQFGLAVGALEHGGAPIQILVCVGRHVSEYCLAFFGPLEGLILMEAGSTQARSFLFCSVDVWKEHIAVLLTPCPGDDPKSSGYVD